MEKTKKTIWISIERGTPTNSIALFQHSYTLTGSDIEWETHWTAPEAVSVELYDWGDGVSNYHNMKHMAASNHIVLLSFVLDKSTGKFSEKR